MNTDLIWGIEAYLTGNYSNIYREYKRGVKDKASYRRAIRWMFLSNRYSNNVYEFNQY
jgi:hypothetical protein